MWRMHTRRIIRNRINGLAFPGWLVSLEQRPRIYFFAARYVGQKHVYLECWLDKVGIRVCSLEIRTPPLAPCIWRHTQSKRIHNNRLITLLTHVWIPTPFHWSTECECTNIHSTQRGLLFAESYACVRRNKNYAISTSAICLLEWVTVETPWKRYCTKLLNEN